MDVGQRDPSIPRAIGHHLLVVYALLASMVVVAVVGSLLMKVHPLAGWGGAFVTGILLLGVLRVVLNRLALDASGQPAGHPPILFFMVWPIGVGLVLAPLDPVVRVMAGMAVVAALVILLIRRLDRRTL